MDKNTDEKICKKNHILVSIVIPVFNKERYISDCINSVIDNGIPSYEIIIVDDGSTDNSLDLCREYESKYPSIKVIPQKHSGVSVARNTGFRYSSGQYIQFVDADDIMCKNYLDIIFSKLNTDYDIIFFDYSDNQSYLDVELKEEYLKSKMIEITSKDDYYKLFSNRIFHNIGTKLYKKNIIHSLFNSNISLYEDITFCLNAMMNAKKMVFFNFKLYFYRRNVSESLSKKHGIDISECVDYYFYVLNEFIKKNNLDENYFLGSRASILYRCFENIMDVNYLYFKNIYIHFKKENEYLSKIKITYKELPLEIKLFAKIFNINSAKILRFYLKNMYKLKKIVWRIHEIVRDHTFKDRPKNK